MNIALWVIAILLAGAFFAAGLGKITTTRPALAEKGMTYVEDFSDSQIKAIGWAEILGAIGLIVPMFVPGLQWLVIVAAFALGVVMIGAVAVHSRRQEKYTPALVLGALAVFLGVGRIVFGF